MAACLNVQPGADGHKDMIVNVEARLEGIYVERKEERQSEQQTEDECVKHGQPEHFCGEERRNKVLFSALGPWRSFRLMFRIFHARINTAAHVLSCWIRRCVLTSSAAIFTNWQEFASLLHLPPRGTRRRQSSNPKLALDPQQQRREREMRRQQEREQRRREQEEKRRIEEMERRRKEEEERRRAEEEKRRADREQVRKPDG